MAKLREWLDKKGFDWESGVILYQECEEDYYNGWVSETDAITTTPIDKQHPILDKEFSSGYGAPECPRILAKDDTAMYFPGQYDGATWLEKVNLDLEFYLENLTPYPGGG
jgi:hypothetical protein